MKATTISFIRQAIISEKVQAFKKYKDLKNHLAKKYQADFFDCEINKDEKDLLYMTQQKFEEAEKALEDFDAHQW